MVGIQKNEVTSPDIIISIVIIESSGALVHSFN